MAKEMSFTITGDDGTRKGKTLKGVVREEGGALTIYVDGYGDGNPVVGVAHQDGNLRVLAFGGAASGEATAIVELEGAKD